EFFEIKVLGLPQSHKEEVLSRRTPCRTGSTSDKSLGLRRPLESIGFLKPITPLLIKRKHSREPDLASVLERCDHFCIYAIYVMSYFYQQVFFHDRSLSCSG